MSINSAAIAVGDPADRSTWRIVDEYVWPTLDRLGRLSGKGEIVPVSQADAFRFVDEYHSHHEAPQGWKWGLGLERDAVFSSGQEKVLIAVVVVGRPVGRMLPQDGSVLEVTRLCVWISRNAASRLLGAVVRRAKKDGVRRLISYTLLEESGASLKAVGFRLDGETAGGDWGKRRRSRRKRPWKKPPPTGPKKRWVLDLV